MPITYIMCRHSMEANLLWGDAWCLMPAWVSSDKLSDNSSGGWETSMNGDEWLIPDARKNLSIGLHCKFGKHQRPLARKVWITCTPPALMSRLSKHLKSVPRPNSRVSSVTVPMVLGRTPCHREQTTHIICTQPQLLANWPESKIK